MTRGIALSIGNPPQHVALYPSLMINSTFIPRYVSEDDYEDCYDVSAPSSAPCSQTYGGGFSAARSSTWNTDASKASLSPSSYDRLFSTSFNRTNGFDTLRVEDASNFAISSMPVVLPKDTFGPFSNSPLGLGEESVFISALQSSSFIPTKSWGLDTNGLCLGCIDAAAANSTFVNVPVGNPVEKNCALQVNVVSVGYNPANGSAEVGISSGTFPACVEPGARSLVLPQTVIDAYAAASSADMSSSKYAAQTKFYLGGAKPDGALVFTLAGDFRVAITLNPMNDSYYWSLPFGVGGWGTYEVGTFVLGQPFTDKIYLKYDDAAKAYGIAGGNTVSTQDIQGLGCELTADTPSVPLSSSSSGGEYPAGAVVGAAFGGILGTFLLTATCCWLWWRRQKGKFASQESDGNIGQGQQKQIHRGTDSIPELVGRNVHEADTGKDSGYTQITQELA